MSRNPTLLIEKRRQEILDAFLKLFCTRRFNEIHIKMISEETSFTRATIYNYFKNIDEIFVSAYQKEYIAWAEDLGLILSGHQQLTHEELARLIAESLSHRELMLRFLLENFRERGYATLGGVILNRRNVPDEREKVEVLCSDIHSRIIADLPRDNAISDAQDKNQGVMEAYPDCDYAKGIRELAKAMLAEEKEA